jgi:hypothetical protein
MASESQLLGNSRVLNVLRNCEETVQVPCLKDNMIHREVQLNSTILAYDQIELPLFYSSVPAKIHPQQVIETRIVWLEIFNQTFSSIWVHFRVGGSVIIMQLVSFLLFVRF